MHFGRFVQHDSTAANGCEINRAVDSIVEEDLDLAYFGEYRFGLSGNLFGGIGDSAVSERALFLLVLRFMEFANSSEGMTQWGSVGE